MIKFYRFKACLFVFISVLCKLPLLADVWPIEGAKVHFINVYFEEERNTLAVKYSLVLSADSSFKKLINADQYFQTNPAFWVNNLIWDKNYYWRVNYLDTLNQIKGCSKTHSFQTLRISNRFFDAVDLRIIKSPSKNSDLRFLAIDYTRSIYNTEGEVLWTLPQIDSLIETGTQIRDIKLTNDNTITLLANNRPIEIDFYGHVLWKAPKPFLIGKDTITFHHEFRKDAEGNYWILGNKLAYRKILKLINKDKLKNEDNILLTDSGAYKRIEIAVLCKFNGAAKLIWNWDANQYIKDVDLNHKLAQNGVPNFHSHANAFNLSNDGKRLYIGFRDLSRIIRVNIATKKVDMSYGEKFPSGDGKFLNNEFRAQHDAFLTSRNSIIVFNNNGSRGGGPSSIIEFSEPNANKASAVLWKFGLDFDTLTNGKSIKGGNVVELSNGNVFVCAGELNRLFEVSKTKEVLWDAFVYSGGKNDSIWQSMPQYRAAPFKNIVMPHFMVETFKTKPSVEIKTLEIKIINTGNVDDFYQIEVLDEQHQILRSTRTGLVLKGSEGLVTVDVSGFKAKARYMLVRSNTSAKIFKLVALH